MSVWSLRCLLDMKSCGSISESSAVPWWLLGVDSRVLQDRTPFPQNRFHAILLMPISIATSDWSEVQYRQAIAAGPSQESAALLNALATIASYRGSASHFGRWETSCAAAMPSMWVPLSMAQNRYGGILLDPPCSCASTVEIPIFRNPSSLGKFAHSSLPIKR